MTQQEEHTALLELIKSSFGIALNANDFFMHACSDKIYLEYEDLHWFLPIWRKYGRHGADAAMAYIAKHEPLEPYMTDKYKEAYQELVALNPKVSSSW
jgi:hypothetical protein